MLSFFVVMLEHCAQLDLYLFCWCFVFDVSVLHNGFASSILSWNP
jgi:hypothetical protein